jgi:hypothetical protein
MYNKIYFIIPALMSTTEEERLSAYTYTYPRDKTPTSITVILVCQS